MIHKNEEHPEFVDFRIVGGNAVSSSRRFPWMVSLQNNGKHFCGAMLIHPSWLLTAKHCVKITATPLIMIGGLDLNNTTEFIMRKVLKVVEHPDLDVALIQLEQPVTDRTPIKVNNNPNINPGINSEAIGWGRLSENGSLTSILQEVSLPLVANDKCASLYSDKFQTNNHLCAGYEEGKKDACQGDSGGPLIIMWDDSDISTQFLIGVTSWGIGCARQGKFGVWVRTSTIIPWITQNIPDFVSYDAMSMANRSKPISISPVTNPPPTTSAGAGMSASARAVLPPPVPLVRPPYPLPKPLVYPPTVAIIQPPKPATPVPLPKPATPSIPKAKAPIMPLPPPLPIPGGPVPAPYLQPTARSIEGFNLELDTRYCAILIAVMVLIILLLWLKYKH